MEIKDIDITRYYCGPLEMAEVLMELYNNYGGVGHGFLTIEQARYLIATNTPWIKDCRGRDVQSNEVVVENINGRDVNYRFVDKCIDLSNIGLPPERIESAVRLLEEKKSKKSPGYEFAFNILAP